MSFTPSFATLADLTGRANEGANLVGTVVKQGTRKDKDNRKTSSSVRKAIFDESPSTSYASVQSPSTSIPLSLVDPRWESIDPTPDVHALFIQFNARFFWQTLQQCEVRWSPRMTTCAGVCSYEGHGGLCSIRLSVPLLKLRPRSDLIETLLHEMIHAYLFVTENNTDRDGHGPNFHSHMHRINGEGGTSISVYHSFHDEVRHHKQHWWRCEGPCRERRPYNGWVKRAVNRAPSKNDNWWAEHQRNCGGQFVKVKEPDAQYKKSSQSSIQQSTSTSGKSTMGKKKPKENRDPNQSTLPAFWSTPSQPTTTSPPASTSTSAVDSEGWQIMVELGDVQCPSCTRMIKKLAINGHLDECLA